MLYYLLFLIISEVASTALSTASLQASDSPGDGFVAALYTFFKVN